MPDRKSPRLQRVKIVLKLLYGDVFITDARNFSQLQKKEMRM